jgi:sec-independent protein translocase protein TatC
MQPRLPENPHPLLSEVESERMEASRAPLVEHLIEFKRRLIFSLLALLVTGSVSYMHADKVFDFLVAPLANSFETGSNRHMIYTSLTEAFTTQIKLSFFAGVLLAFPVIAFHIYRFVAPGLYRKEKGVLLPYLIASPALFFAGAAMAYYYVFPTAWAFFVSFEQSGLGSIRIPVELQARVSEYLSLSMHVIMAFGLAFQLPVVLTLLARAGFLSVQTLINGRRYAAVILVSVAAIITPPDVISQLGLFVPLYILYEVSILICRSIERKKAQQSPSSL